MIKLNVGSGSDYREGWVNCDFVDTSFYDKDTKKQKVDVIFNFKFGWPFKENSVDYVLMREVFEHVNRHDAVHLLQEAYRILKPGGKMEITVPPAEKQMKLFLGVMNRPTSMDEFKNAHERPYNPWKALDDLAGGTIKTVVNDKDIGDAMSHKAFYSISMLQMLTESFGFKTEKITKDIHYWGVK